jgi:hypothetical protein
LHGGSADSSSSRALQYALRSRPDFCNPHASGQPRKKLAAYTFDVPHHAKILIIMQELAQNAGGNMHRPSVYS